MLVECKRLIKDEKDLQAAAAQVRSYALWMPVAYYVISDARIVSVWDFQDAIAPDKELMRIPTRSQQAVEHSNQPNKRSKFTGELEGNGAGDGNRTRMTSLEGCWPTQVTYSSWSL